MKFYNKCIQYVLEMVGLSANVMGIGQSDIDVKIESGICNQYMLRKYIDACRMRPMHNKANNLRKILPENIFVIDKASGQRLQIADLAAHALYRCIENNEKNYGVLETRYLDELRTKYFCDPATGLVLDWGIKAIHHVGNLGLDAPQLSFLTDFNARA